MIRSRSIPTVLSRAIGDGIHAILLIDANGELLGSYGSPPPTHEPDNAAGSLSSVVNPNPLKDWPLDAASIGALISEVAGDYKRLGEELVLLDPENSRRSSEKQMSDDDRQKMMQRESASSGDEGVKESAAAASKGGKEKGSLDSGVNMKSLVIELEHGFVGVASAGSGYYVIALADPNVQQGALAGRLRSLGLHVREAFSQLD
ncbi:hypothetical protein ACHAXN_012894 [Cyclotella atomus]